MRIWTPVLILALLAGCAHAGPTTTSVQAPAALQAADTSSNETITPEDARKRATEKALEWQKDARLVAVGWGVAKFELASMTFHVFHSPKAGRLFLVQTKVVGFWQKTQEITDRRYTVPARLLATLDTYPVSAEDALKKAKTYLPSDDQHPIAVLAQFKPHLLPAVWGVQADKQNVLIDAQNGKVLLHTDINFPPLPFSQYANPDQTQATP